MWPVDEIVEALSSVVEAVVTTVQDSAETVLLDTIKITSEALTNPLSALTGSLLELPLDVFSASAITPWDQAISEKLNEASNEVTVIVDMISDPFSSGIPIWYVPQPHQWIETLFDELPGSARDVGLFIAGGFSLLNSLPWAMLDISSALMCGLAMEIGQGAHSGRVINAVAAGEQLPGVSIATLPSNRKYFIGSDFHRYVAGPQDVPEQQGTKKLYADVLLQYKKNGYWLIENGDVEDFWLRGGQLSQYAEQATAFALPPLNGPAKEDALEQAAVAHLRDVVSSNANIYATVLEDFHKRGHYVRTIGNHDDVYHRSTLAQALAEYFPGLEIVDYVVLQKGSRALGIICHGHQTDSWNSEPCAASGRAVTAMSSYLRDVSFEKMKLGTPRREETDALWTRAANELHRVAPFLGLWSDLNSLDEVKLFGSYRRVWSEQGPILIMGHTHAPLTSPVLPDSEIAWSEYYNSGCGIFEGTITGIEWDGTGPADPVVRVVCWRQGRDGPERGVIQRHPRNHHLTLCRV